MTFDNTVDSAPLQLRVAIISHASEIERRSLIRDLVFKGVPEKFVKVEHRFFIGDLGERALPEYHIRT